MRVHGLRYDMKKIIAIFLIGLILTGCSILRVHKVDVDQGNVFTQADIAKLQIGMTEAQVVALLGHPVLINIFTPNRKDYVYTFKPGQASMSEKRLTIVFQVGRVRSIY